MNKVFDGYCRCGHIVAAVLDSEDPETGEDVKQWLRDGLLLIMEGAPVTVYGCTCAKPNKQQVIREG